MIKGPYDQLKQIAWANVCADDGGDLEIAWHSAERSYVIRCGQGHYPERVTRQLSLSEQHRAGAPLPLQIENNISTQRRLRMMSNSQKPVNPMTALLPRADLATGEFLSPQTIAGLVSYAQRYGLDAYRGHVVLMYGEPYITLDGYLYHAAQLKKPYSLSSHPMTPAERALYIIPDGAHAWLCEIEVYMDKTKVTGVGIVTHEEMTEESKKKPGQLRYPIVAAKPWQMAQKRAEWQALRRAFPIGEAEELTREEENHAGKDPA